MGKVSGFIACSSVLTAALLWWVNVGQTADRFAAKPASYSASEQLVAGKASYLNGDYAQAVQALEAAEAAGSHLSESQRRDLAAYLRRARERQASESKSSGVVVRGQSGEPRSARIPGTSKQSAQKEAALKLMRDAQAAMQRNDRATAIQIATRANSFPVKWAPNEVSPDQFLKAVQTIGSPKTSPEVVAQTGEKTFPVTLNADDRKANAPRWLAEARHNFNIGNIEEARRGAKAVADLNLKTKPMQDSAQKLLQDIETHVAQENAWSKDHTSAKAKRERSKYLLGRSLDMVEHKETEVAIALLEEAEALSVERGYGDPTPDDVRKALLQKKVRLPAKAIATTRKPAATPSPVHNMPKPVPSLSDSPQVSSTRRSIDLFMRKAHSALDKGDIAQATSWANNARTLAASGKVAFGPGEESPDSFLTSMQQATPANAIARTEEPASDEPTALPTRPEPKPLEVAETEPAEMPKALAADESAEPAAAVPEAVADDQEILTLDDPQPSKSRTLPETVEVDGLPEARMRAQQLLTEAKSDIKAGRFDAARAKAEQVQQMDEEGNLTYELLDTRPEHVIAEVEAKSTGRPKKTPEKMVAKSASDKQQALELLKGAQADLDAGRIEEARQKALQAENLDVTYSMLEPTPSHLLFDIDRKAKGKGTPNPAQVAESTPAEELIEPAVAAHTTKVLPGGSTQDDQSQQVAAEVPTELTAQSPASAAEDGSQVALLEPIADEGPGVVNPRGQTAMELYQEGLKAIRSQNRDLAYQCFKQAFESGERLPPELQRDLGDKLRAMAPPKTKTILPAAAQVADGDIAGAQPTEEAPKELEAVAEQRQLAIEKLRSEVANDRFKATQLAKTDPAKAVEVINKALLRVENSNLDENAVKPMLRSLASARDEINREAKVQAPILENKKRNEEVLSEIKRRGETTIKIEQELAEKVKKYNELFDQRRYSEAEVIAKQAKQLAPENAVTMVMMEKVKFAKQIQFNADVRDRKGDYFTKSLNDVDESAAGPLNDISFVKDWQDLTKRRKQYGLPDGRSMTPSEEKIKRSLNQTISLHFQNQPLGEVIKQVQAVAQVNLHLDEQGLQEEGVDTSKTVTINVDDIPISSVLRLVLEPMGLNYIIQNDVLKITSKRRSNGDLLTVNYSVADLIVPIPNFTPIGAMGMQADGTPNTARAPVAPTQPGFGQKAPGMFAVTDESQMESGFPSASDDRTKLSGGGTGANFGPLISLITTTINPDTWEDNGGDGRISQFTTTLSLVVRQTQEVHEDIADLLRQLRRLQDLQVTIEVRFITVSDRFFERIGIDFDFNVHDNIPDDLPNTFGQRLPPFGGGTPLPGGAQGGTTGTTGTSGTTGAGGGANVNFQNGPPRDLVNRNNFPKYGVVSGLLPDGSFPADMDIPFRQGSFQLGVPRFGGFQADAGLSVGLAILSDIETFFLISASQGDDRNNLLFAPKVTLFNGQQATVQDNVQRPFVTSLIPTVGFFSVGFQPQITVINDGVTMQVQAVVSADRRFVRLTVSPVFTAITDVQTFSFLGGSGGAGQQGQTGQQGQVGQQQGGQGQGFGGGFGGQAGQGGQFGVGGIGGLAGVGGQTGQQGQQGQTGQQQGQTGAAATQITVQQPIVEVINIGTTVLVPDGGTVLLGGIKRLREGRQMAGVPILNKIPYINRLFKNTGVGRETESLMMMVTPRIIILEEEESLLGVPL